MKEARCFFVPRASELDELPEEEAQHAFRVLRLHEGDDVMLADGEGRFFQAVLTEVGKKGCRYSIKESLSQTRQWAGHIHLAIAPTKMMERNEWLAEKATEIGFDELTFLDCRFSERRTVNIERISKIVVSAVKQSRKAWMPKVNGIVSFENFIASHKSGRRYIAHCYEEVSREPLFSILKMAVAPREEDETIVMIGPEGDFSIDEVNRALAAGFVSVDLGRSRLRTETAGLSAVMMMQLAHSAII